MMKNILCREPGCGADATHIAIATLPTGNVEAVAGAWCKEHAELNALIHETEERLKADPKAPTGLISGAGLEVLKSLYGDAVTKAFTADRPFFGLLPKKGSGRI